VSIHIGYPGGLEKARTDYQAKVDRAAGEARLRYITSIPGQDATYTSKLADAQRYLATSPEPETLDAFPWLAGEVHTYGLPPLESAQNIVDISAAWTEIGVHIEELRLSAKAAIRSSLAIAAMHTVATDAIAALEDV
jgi:hypothetical protein